MTRYSEEKLREALSKMCDSARNVGGGPTVFSIPTRPDVDANCILAAGINELVYARARIEKLVEFRKIILELMCSELGLCADAFQACHNASETLRTRTCGCGTAARNVRAVISRIKETIHATS